MVHYMIPTTKQKYNLLSNMKTRCYGENQRKQYSCYENCCICYEWLEDAKKFYNWADEHYYTIDNLPDSNIQLDKDILVPGNLVYSPDTCMFIPDKMNLFFKSLNKKSVFLPPGVRKLKNEKYQSEIGIEGKKKIIGIYNTVEEAQEAYKTEKIKECERIADYYKDMVPEKVTEAFLQWRQSIRSMTPENFKEVFSKNEIENAFPITYNSKCYGTREILTCLSKRSHKDVNEVKKSFGSRPMKKGRQRKNAA